MQHFLWGKVVLVLVAVVAILQVVHLILLSRLEARHHHHEEQNDQVASAANEVEAAFAVLVRALHQGRVLDASGEYQLVPNLAPGSRQPQIRATGPVSDVALVTQCSFNHLHHLVTLVQRWQDFFEFASKSRLFTESHREDKTVYVVPAFEVRDTVSPPHHKAELLALADQGHLRPFYIELCWKCQVHTDYEAWQKEPPSIGLAPLFEVLWKDPWEPFYIARNSVPFYDERFKQYGFNRISQVCELHVAGYKFSVLNNGFLVHRGLKTASSFHVNKDADQERNRMLFRQFKTELRDKYPESSRRCY